MPLLSQIFASQLCTSWRSYINDHGVHVFTWRCVAYRWTIGVSNMFWKTINGQCWFLLYRTTSAYLVIPTWEYGHNNTMNTVHFTRSCSATLSWVRGVENVRPPLHWKVIGNFNWCHKCSNPSLILAIFRFYYTEPSSGEWWWLCNRIEISQESNLDIISWNHALRIAPYSHRC